MAGDGYALELAAKYPFAEMENLDFE